MTLRMLAEKVGVSAPFLSDLEHDRRGTDRLAEFARVLDVPEAELSRLDGRVAPDLKEWLAANPPLVSLLRELQSSGRPIPIDALRDAALRKKK